MDDDNDDLAILKRSSLANALEQQLERMIVSGELQPGARLSEIQLANRFGISRGPVREAARSLQAKGFVEAIRNRGVFVRQLSMDEAREIYEVRGALFAAAGSAACRNGSGALLDELAKLIELMKPAAEANDIETYYPLNLKFHDVILDAAQNALLKREYDHLVDKMHLFRRRSLVQGGGLAVSNKEHEDILNALRAGDAERVHIVAWSHVNLARSRLMTAATDVSAELVQRE